MSAFVIFNGEMIAAEEKRISFDNRSFRYGDGCFETMKVVNGKIINAELHLQRLLASLSILKLKVPLELNAKLLIKQVVDLVKSNQHEHLARVRLTVFRSEDFQSTEYIIQTWKGEESSNNLNKEGLVVDFFPDARKAIDIFSQIKSNNYLPYLMSSIWAKEKGLNDAIVYNSDGRIADASIANVFIIKDGLIQTSALTEGCVNGVMRMYLLKSLKQDDFPLMETSLTAEDILQASEVFLTNAITGIRWVKKAGNSEYSNDLTATLYSRYILPLFS